jgi:endonuclease/exonuclease/phosphatase family metal-dependent hydrolase
MTYNIQKFPLFKSFEPIKRLIEKYSVILLQECYDESFASLESYFPNHYICRGTLQGFNAMNSGLAILSIYPILETNFIRYHNFNGWTLDRFTEKGFLTALLDVSDKNENKKILIINTHLQSCDFEEYDPIAFLKMDELLAYTSHINTPYLIGGDFNIDVTECKKKYPTLSIYQPSDPTIYINFSNAHSKSSPGEDYQGLIFDYFISKNRVKAQTVSNDYSDHNPVTGMMII